MNLNFTKEQIKQMLVIGIVLIFIFEMLAMTLSTNTREADKNDSSITGAVISSFRVLSYAPYIKVGLEGFNESDLLSIEHVDLNFSRPMEKEGIYLVAVDESAYVSYVYKELLGKGYSGLTDLRVSVYNATFVGSNTSFPPSTFFFSGEPIYLLNETYMSTFVGTINGNQQSISQFVVIPVDKNVTIKLNWTLQKYKYVYAVPWEYRNGYGNLTNYSQLGEIQKQNYFISNISKQAPYVTSVIGEKHFVLSNFTDKELVLSDFPDAVFPDAILKADYEVELPFNYTLEHVCYAFLPTVDEHYYYGNRRVFYTSSNNITGEQDTLVSLKLNGLKVISVQVLSVGGFGQEG